MTAWEPPERVVVSSDYIGFMEAFVPPPNYRLEEDEAYYVPESVALERERVLREALERYVRLDEAGCVDDGDSGALDQALAALASQGGGA